MSKESFSEIHKKLKGSLTVISIGFLMISMALCLTDHGYAAFATFILSMVSGAVAAYDTFNGY